jgi:hypothetical protein
LNILSFEAFEGQTAGDCSGLHVALCCVCVCPNWSATSWRAVPTDIRHFYGVGQLISSGILVEGGGKGLGGLCPSKVGYFPTCAMTIEQRYIISVYSAGCHHWRLHAQLADLLVALGSIIGEEMVSATRYRPAIIDSRFLNGQKVALKKLPEWRCGNFSVGRKSKRSNIRFNECESPKISIWNTIPFGTCREMAEPHLVLCEDTLFSKFVQSF